MSALDPFDVMRATRALAPHDARLNDLRWLTGEALRRLHARATQGELSSLDPAREPAPPFHTHRGDAKTAARLAARDRLAELERRAGARGWPLLRRVVLEGAALRDCRDLISELTTPWRADAVLADRLRGALDDIGAALGIVGRPDGARP